VSTSLQTYVEGSDGFPDLGGVVAKSVTIDNYSQSWAWVPMAGRFVRPLTYGAILNLQSPTTTGVIEWRTPGVITAPPLAVPPGSLTATWSDAIQTPSAGLSVFAAQTQPILLGKIANGDNTHHTFPLPPGLMAFAVISNGSPTVIITGVQTGLIYISNAIPLIPGSGGSIFGTGAIYLQPQDSQLDCVVTGGVGGIAVVGYPTTIPATIQVVTGVGGNPLPVSFTQPISVTDLPGVPVTILGASALTALTPGTVMVTIPAGRTWKGAVWATTVNMLGGGIASVTVVGVGALPAPGTTLVTTELHTVAGASGTPVVADTFVSAPAGNVVTLNALANNAAATGVLAAALGVLL
jgi:hypothetical protein